MKFLRDLASNAFTLAIAVVAGGFAAAVIANHQYTKPGPLAAPTYVDIPQGATLPGAVEQLVGAGAVGSATMFRLAATVTGRENDIKHGSFEIPAGASMSEVLAIITSSAAAKRRFIAIFRAGTTGGEHLLRERIAGSGEFEEVARFNGSEEPASGYAEIMESGVGVEYRVVIPEGLTSWQIAAAIGDAEFLEGRIDSPPAEGSLAPNTYEVARGSSARELIGRMSAAQARILEEEWERKPEGGVVSSPEEALVLASIIEKETGRADERTLVAAVFANRLNLKMPLQSDPTVIYGVTDGQGYLGRGLRKSELESDGPYNTYKNRGLPPTPISNPGRASIRAALNPAESDYLYFVADGTGGHAFARTYEEHRRNVREWRKIEAERRNGG